MIGQRAGRGEAMREKLFWCPCGLFVRYHRYRGQHMLSFLVQMQWRVSGAQGQKMHMPQAGVR